MLLFEWSSWGDQKSDAEMPLLYWRLPSSGQLVKSCTFLLYAIEVGILLIALCDRGFHKALRHFC